MCGENKEGKKKKKEAADMTVQSFLCQLHRRVTWLGMTLFLLTLEAVLCWALQERDTVKLKQYYTGLHNRPGNKHAVQQRKVSKEPLLAQLLLRRAQ